MATGPSSPEERAKLVDEARSLAGAASEGPPETFEPSATSIDVALASLAARVPVDRILASGRMRALKSGLLKVCTVFLRDQATVNRLTVTALEDVIARLESIERRLDDLEGRP